MITRKMTQRRWRLEALEARCLLSAGDLDLGFGVAGTLSVDVQGNGSADTPAAVAVQTINGVSKELVVGWTVVSGVSQPFVLRLTPSGTLDSTFAGGGKEIVSVAKTTAQFYQLAVLPDGSFVAVGDSLVKSTSSTYDTQVILARFTPDGTLDASFGNSGVVGTNLKAGIDAGYSVAVQPDGKLVVVGLSQKSPDGFGRLNDNGFIARYSAGGALDGTFGTGGVAYISDDTAATATADHLSSVTVQAAANGAVTSYTMLGEVSTNSGTHAVVTRLTPTGTRSAGWGQGNGRVDLAIGATPFGTIRGLAIDQNGRVIVAGNAASGQFAGTIAVLTAQGALDTSFTGGDPAVPLGYSRVPYPTSAGFDDVAVDASNRIVVSGLQQIYSASAGDDVDDNIQTFRFLPTGQQDTTFGAANGGYGLADATPAAGANSNEHAAGLAIQPDGKVVVAGATSPFPMPSSKSVDLFVARFQADTPLGAAFRTRTPVGKAPGLTLPETTPSPNETRTSSTPAAPTVRLHPSFRGRRLPFTALPAPTKLFS